MNKLSPEEVAVTQMALSGLIEDMEAVSKDAKPPFTPEARKYQRQILTAAKSAKAKFVTASGKEVSLDPYKEGDETEFLTKQS